MDRKGISLHWEDDAVSLLKVNKSGKLGDTMLGTDTTLDVSVRDQRIRFDGASNVGSTVPWAGPTSASIPSLCLATGTKQPIPSVTD